MSLEMDVMLDLKERCCGSRFSEGSFLLKSVLVTHGRKEEMLSKIFQQFLQGPGHLSYSSIQI